MILVHNIRTDWDPSLSPRSNIPPTLPREVMIVLAATMAMWRGRCVLQGGIALANTGGSGFDMQSVVSSVLKANESRCSQYGGLCLAHIN